MFVRRVELDEIPVVRLQSQNLGPEQGSVVVMDDVELLAVEDFEDRIRLRPGPSHLLGHQRRQKSQAASQAVYGYVRVIGEGLRGLALGQHLIAVHAVNHVHFVPQPRQ